MLNGNYNNINLGFNCTTLSSPSFENQDFKHFVVNRQDSDVLYLKMDVGRKLDIKVYNFMGQQIGQLANEYYMPGVHEIDIKATLQTRLASGNYIYRISSGTDQYSSQFLIR
ncbi:twin-arginine translocation pathway signal precursor [Nonlabens ulvanivorans]|nr:T9SS type A sorting domain-containing protein [Nonlabens ulvanivorans]GAK92589.1 twin-arginine translocation pathway signal precursor [Nonlabens ulvanivorans]